MRRSRAYGAMALLAGSALVLTACGSSSSGGTSNTAAGPQNEDPTKLAVSQPYFRPKVPDAGTVTVAVDETFTNYNNNLGSTSNQANNYIVNLLQPSVFFVNDVNNTIKVQMDGDLMSAVKDMTTGGQQKIEYDIKPEAVWQDGAPVDCADFYLQWLSSAVLTGDVATAFNSSLTGYDSISSLACSNNNKTVTATFAKPFADWQSLFSQLPPAHVLTKALGMTEDQLTKLNDTAAGDKATLLKVADFYSGGANADHGFAAISLANDLSAGPFELQSADGKGETVLVRNPKWWANPAGPAKLDVRTNTDDQSAYQQLQNKEIQVFGGQPNAQVALQVKGSGGAVKLITGIGTEWEHLDYNNVNADFKAYPELRQALSLCVNRADVISKVISDINPNIKPLGSVMFLPTENGYVDNYTNTGNGDAAAVKTLMQSKGWTLGPNGFFTKNGKTASITIGHKTQDRRESTVQAIQAECKQAGIQINDFSSDGFNGKNLPAGDFQVALFAWVGTPFKSPNDAIYQTGGGENYNKYSNATVDKSLSDADHQLDYAKRIKDYQTVDQQVAKDGFTLPLFPLPEFALSDGSISSTDQSGKVTTLQDNESSSGILWDAFSWQKASS